MFSYCSTTLCGAAFAGAVLSNFYWDLLVQKSDECLRSADLPKILCLLKYEDDLDSFKALKIATAIFGFASIASILGAGPRVDQKCKQLAGRIKTAFSLRKSNENSVNLALGIRPSQAPNSKTPIGQSKPMNRGLRRLVDHPELIGERSSSSSTAPQQKQKSMQKQHDDSNFTFQGGRRLDPNEAEREQEKRKQMVIAGKI